MNATIHPSEIPRVRNWKGAPLSPVEEIFMFHKATGPVPETFQRLQGGLEREGREWAGLPEWRLLLSPRGRRPGGAQQDDAGSLTFLAIRR